MKKNKLILLQLMIAATLICTSVYAAVNTTISLSASGTTVHRGDEITVTLALEDVDSSKKVESIEGYINYNKDILETVTVDSIEKNENGTVKIGDEELPVEDLTNKTEVSSTDSYVAFNGSPSSGNDIKIVIDFKNGISSDVELLKIKFKVKSDAELGTVANAISYEMFQITAGNETLPDITKNINLTVEKVATEEPDNTPENKPVNNTNTNKNTNNTVKNTNTNTNKNTNTTKNNATKNTNTNTAKQTNSANSNKDNTVAGASIPAAGSKVVILPVIVLIVLAYISYNKYMNYKNI